MSFGGSHSALVARTDPAPEADSTRSLNLSRTDMLALADKGDNSSVDMLVGDIYGQDYQKIGLKSSTIASSFGKVFRRGEGHGDALGEEDEEERRKSFKPEDISRSLLYAISNNIGQIA